MMNSIYCSELLILQNGIVKRIKDLSLDELIEIKESLKDLQWHDKLGSKPSFFDNLCDMNIMGFRDVLSKFDFLKPITLKIIEVIKEGTDIEK